MFNESLDITEQAARLHRMLDTGEGLHPDMVHDLSDIMTQMVHLGRAGELEEMVEKYAALYPAEYGKEYDWLEKLLINYHFFRDDAGGVRRRLRWPREFPVEGVDVVTMRAFYQLLYHGLYPEALDFTGTVWRPLAESPRIWGEPHMEFCLTIMVDGLEKAWARMKEGERVDWDKFVRNMKEHGVDPEDINYEVIIDGIERPFDLEEITEMIEEGKKSGWTLFLREQFIKFMKDRFGIPFILSDNWWTIMYSKKFLRKGEDPGDVFNVSFKRLDRAFSRLYDFHYRTNDLEVFGKVFGIKYVYYFLKETGLISEKIYRKMKVRIDALELMFERVARDELWSMTFVFDWPQLEPEDPDRRAAYASTFIEDEEDEFPAFIDRYLEERLEQFNEKTRTRIESDVIDF